MERQIEVGALVLLRMQGEECWFLFAPAAGGTEVSVDGTEITVVTPEAPLGEALAGRTAGERIASPEAEVLRVL